MARCARPLAGTGHPVAASDQVCQHGQDQEHPHQPGCRTSSAQEAGGEPPVALQRQQGAGAKREIERLAVPRMGVERVGTEGHQATGNPGADRDVVCVDELDEEVDTDRQGECSGDDEGVFETESRQTVPEPGQQREQGIESPVRRIAGRMPGRHRVIAIEDDRAVPGAVPATERPQSQRLPKNPVSVAADEDPGCDLADDGERQSDQDLPPPCIQPASRPVRPRGRGARLSHECSTGESCGTPSLVCARVDAQPVDGDPRPARHGGTLLDDVVAIRDEAGPR